VPHILLEGRASIRELQAAHRPFALREGERLVKVERFYADERGEAALVETLVVERSHTQKFFILVAARPGGLAVRLEPMTDPEKSPGVKRALAIVAERLRRAIDGRYGSTNISEYLVSGDAPVEEGD
jgi:hypothetical protein